MPTPHRRIGLIVDDPLERALDLFRGDEVVPEAQRARRAVFEGALVEATVAAAEGGGVERERAADVVAGLRDLLPSLALADPVKEVIRRRLEGAGPRLSPSERRRRQLALMAGPPAADRQTAQDLAEFLDAFERLPPR